MAHFCNVFSGLERDTSFGRDGETVPERWPFNVPVA